MSVPLSYFGIVIIWTTTPLTIKWSGEDVGFLFGVSMRMIIALVICAAIIMLMRRSFPLDRKSLHAYLAVGLPLYTAMTCVYWGAQYLPSGIIAVLFGLTPLFTALLASVWLSEQSLTPAKIVGMVFGLCGLAVIFHHGVEFGQVMILSMLAVLTAAFMHSLGTVWVKHAAADLPILTMNTGGLVIAVFLYSISWLMFDGSVPEQISEHTVVSIIYLGIVGSVFGAVLFYYALKRVQASTMGLLPLITPVSALLLGQWANDEVVEVNTMIGTALILFGLLVHQWSKEIVSVYQRLKSIV